MKSQRPSFIFSHYSSFSGVHLLLRVTEVSGSEISPHNCPRPLYIIRLANKLERCFITQPLVMLYRLTLAPSLLLHTHVRGAEQKYKSKCWRQIKRWGCNIEICYNAGLSCTNQSNVTLTRQLISYQSISNFCSDGPALAKET